MFEKKVAQVEPKVTTHIRTELYNSQVFNDVRVQGKAYIVYDIINEKIISSKNPEVILPIASITKVMTALTARTHYAKNSLISILPTSIEGSYDIGLRKGQVFSLDEILKYTLVFSSNDGAQAIADNLGGREGFVKQMNSDALLLGLKLHFTHPAGLDEDDLIGGEGSALSVAKLITLAITDFPEVFDVTTKTRVTVNSSTGKISGVPNTNQRVYHLPGIEMSKTGYTDKAGGNLVVVVDVAVGRPVAIVVLGSTREARFSDVETLYTALKKSTQ